IIAEGVLRHKVFEGKLLADDPNISLAFDGSMDFSHGNQWKFNASANLLQSNLHALNLTRDTVLLSAAFNLDCTASTIDDFTGHARLYNIELTRNQDRVNLDSIYVHAGETAPGNKFIFVKSNDLDASVQGDFRLSTLPFSVQHYLYGYLPNYIPAP